MKTTTLLTYSAAFSFALFFAQLLAGQYAAIAGAAFCLSLFVLVVVHDYTRRTYRWAIAS